MPKSRLGFSKALHQTRFSSFSSTNGGTSKSQKQPYFRITFCQDCGVSMDNVGVDFRCS
ncbi:hypothetical protein C1H46_009686 [Malus baccata]|uniref:Uncharacterized protein n=1 Tax=Malus baccata TaxID=106549 RepID=A0A540N2D3_MALBA|nr:hypothetical protein C1H46_009686 [Malus baccata]